jgi:hypothetical protein
VLVGWTVADTLGCHAAGYEHYLDLVEHMAITLFDVLTILGFEVRELGMVAAPW